MGDKDINDASPVHNVYLDAFWIDKNEVTNEQYGKCVTDNECEQPDPLSFFHDPEFQDHPVVFVNWFDAQSYCTWAGRRLPTEAEWEKAARGSNGRLYPWGNSMPTSELLNFANHNEGTTSIGSFPDGVSPYGVLDMAGNVWEWTADWYRDNYYSVSPVENPQGPESGTRRVVRGGCWMDNYLKSIRTAKRWYNIPESVFSTGSGSKSPNLGFRCAASITGQMPVSLVTATE